MCRCCHNTILVLQALDEAMEVFVHAIADYHRVTCPSLRGVCDAMAKIADTNDVAKSLYHHMKNVSFKCTWNNCYLFAAFDISMLIAQSV